MSELPSVDQVLRINITWKMDAELNAGVRMYWRYKGPGPSGSGVQAIASHVQTGGTSFLAPLANVNTFCETIEVLDLGNKEGHSAEVPGWGAGTRAGQALPSSNCLLVNHHIARHYRGGKPRTYLPGGVNADLGSQQTWSNAALSDFDTKFQAFVGNMNGYKTGETELSEHVNVSYYAGGEWFPREPPPGRHVFVPKKREHPFVDSINSSSVNPVIGIQKRRLRPG